MPRVNYVVVLVDRGEARFLHGQTTGYFKVTFHESCTQVHGLRFKYSRPTAVINEIKHRDAKYHEWFTHCIEPMLAKAEYIDYYEEEVQENGE